MIQTLIEVLSGRRMDLMNSGGDEDYHWTAVKLTNPDEIIILASRTYRDGTVLIRKAGPEDIQKIGEKPWYSWNHPRGSTVGIIDV